MVEAVGTQQQPFTEPVVSQMHEQVRELAQQRYTDEEELERWLGKLDSELQATSGKWPTPPQHFTDKDELEGWLGKLDSELQEISGLQERGNHLQGALKELQGEEAKEEGLGGEGECTVEDLQIAY